MKPLIILLLLTVSFLNADQPPKAMLADCDKRAEAPQCLQSGMVYYMKPKSDPIKGEKYLNKACKLDISLCYNVGSLWEFAMWVQKKDYKKAYKYYLKSCNNYSAKTQDNACARIGHLYYEGKGVKQDYNYAWQYFSRSCDKGYGDACFMLGLMHYKGKNFKKNNSKAVKYFKKACDGKDGNGCLNAGLFYSAGKGIRQSYSTAKEYFGKACDLEVEEGCKQYSNLNKKGY